MVSLVVRCVLLLLFVLPDSTFAAEISFDEIRSGFQKNMQSLGAYSYLLQVANSTTKDHYDVIKKRVARIEPVLESVPPENRALVEKMLRRWKSELRGHVEGVDSRSTRTVAIAMGPRSFQAIVQRSRNHEAFPKFPVFLREELTKSYLDYIVLSWSPDQTPQTWFWQGKGGRDDGVNYATISTKRPQLAVSFPVPPVSELGKSPFELNQLSPIDSFFQTSFPETRIIGQEEVNGKNTIVVERLDHSSSVKEVAVKAWISPEQGFFPVRIERKTFRKGRELESVEPHEILEISSFHQSKNGAFFPAAWTVTNKVDDDRDPSMRSRVPRKKMVLYTKRVEEWSVKRFRGHQQHPELLSKIGFPVGTKCYDEAKKSYFIVKQDD